MAWSVGHSYIDTVTGDMCPINQLGGRSVARGLLTPDNSLFALVDNELGPETLTVGRYDGQQWEYHDLATPGGAWTSVMAADGSTVVILVANLEPEPGPDSLNGFVYTTDGGETWTEVSDPAVLRQNLPFSTALSDNLEDWFSGYTSMALADPSTVYVADGNGELWRSDDFSTFSPIEVSGFVSDLRPTADGVIARVDDNSLIHISADGTVDARTSR